MTECFLATPLGAQLNDCEAERAPRQLPTVFKTLLALMLWLLSAAAMAQHFDVELRTDKGPVAGSRIQTDFFGDLGLAGQLPFDAQSGYRIFPAYFGDFPGGKYKTANPGFQAFGGTFLQGELIHFRALGSLLFWNPSTGKWGPAASGVKVTLFGGIPPEVVLGYSTNPALWTDQYAYYQAGTRFETSGISGPLTALIDDVKVGGSFHSHLDWKISNTSGNPPVGAYMVTLELWSPTLVGGQPKYLASQPFHVIFEAGINAAQMEQAFAARITPPCEGQPLAWTVGANSCSASVAETSSGTSVVVSDLVAPATGTASFSCSRGNWGSPNNATCALPSPAACASQSLSWSVGALSCSATAPATVSGAAATLSDTLGPTLGEARFSCSDGAWGAPSNASCAVPPPPACAAQSMSWTVGGQSCSAAVAATASGGAAIATDTVSPATGSASFSCGGGSWSAPAAASCAVPPPAACSAQSLTWTQAGNSCNAVVPTTNSGATAQAADQVQPATGTANFACNAGVWAAASNASCSLPPPAACAAQTLSWTVAGNSCSATVQETASGNPVIARDAALPLTGAANFTCSNGTWSAASQASCAAPPAAACPAQVAIWVEGAHSCSANLPNTVSGANAAVRDAVEPATGTASFSCNAGVWSAPSNASCTVPAPAACAAQSMIWTVGGQSCSASLASADSGASAIATDTVSPATGSASFSCSSGSWSAPAAASCAVPPPAACSAQSLSWTQAGNSCSAAVPTTASGATAQAADQVQPATGTANFACNAGVWAAASNASCSLPPPAACVAQTLSWTVAGNSCSATVQETASGNPVIATDAALPLTGAASFTCSNGTWSAASQASCAAPPAAACPAQVATWVEGAHSCSANLPSTNSGASAAARDAIEPATGTANFSCSAGVWGAPSNANCAVPPPPACAAQSMSWTVGGQSCSAALATTASGASAIATDTVSPATGSASFSCSSGSWSAPAAASCAVPPPAACSAQSLSWTQAGNSCTAAVPGTASGATVLASDQVQPATGTANFACNAGVWAAASNTSCSPPPPAACAAQTLGWTVGPELCQAAAPGAASGSQLQITDLSLPSTGAASFVCTDGQWSAPREASCSLPPVKPLPPARTSTSPWAPSVQLPWERARR